MQPYLTSDETAKESTSCIEHYLALIAACMPTLGPLFRWLRPSQWSKHAGHLALGPKINHYDDGEAFHRSWPHYNNNATSPDHSLMNESIHEPSELIEQGFGGLGH